MTEIPQDVYLSLMITVRRRFDFIDQIRTTGPNDFSTAEVMAFHGRKIIERIAFGCLVATENGINHVPRDARGQWNAEAILKSLASKNLSTFPSPSIIRNATSNEQRSKNVKVVIEGVPERRLTQKDLVSVYQRLHRWLHEVNPYIEQDRNAFFSKYSHQLAEDSDHVRAFIEKHFISISGEGFFCVLWDDQDGLTKVRSLSKIEETFE